jgi:hypothetical protein
MTHRSSTCCNTQYRYHSATRGQDIHRHAHCPRKHANRVPQYYALLLSASTYDEANGLKNGPTEVNNIETLDTSNKREVNATEGNTKYEAFVSKFYKPSQTRMTKDVWNSITKEEVWDTLSRDKANILNFIPKTGEREVNIVEFDPTQEPPKTLTMTRPFNQKTTLLC